MIPNSNNYIRENILHLPQVDVACTVNQVHSIGEVVENTLMFVNKSGINLSEIDTGEGNIILIDEELYSDIPPYTRNDFIRVKNPKYEFCRLQSHLCLPSKLQREFDDNYNLTTYAARKNFADNIYCRETIIGEGVSFDHGSIIGGTDFSPVEGNTPYELLQFPQAGGVIIGNYVTVKYNSMIGKGTFGFTTIGNNTMIDYGCQIGHNCNIGSHCIIAAGTIIGGSTIVGSNTVIGIGAKIRNGLKIGKNVSIGMGSVVIRDIPDNAVVVGNPAHIIEHEKIFDKKGLI